MAVEDIPPKKPTGLGDRLSDILARQAVGNYESYERTLFGGEVTATSEEVSGALSSVYEKPADRPLPPPSDVTIIDQAYGSKVVRRKTARSGLTWKRPDLDVTAYGQGGSMRSTRVWGIQWIPTVVLNEEPFLEKDISARNSLYGYDLNSLTTENTFGDILVAFARPSNLQSNSLYVFSNNAKSTWEAFSTSSSFGRSIRILNGGRPFKDSDSHKYASLHPTVSDSTWIFGSSYMDRWSTTREVSASGAGLSVGFIEEFIEGFFGEKRG